MSEKKSAIAGKRPVFLNTLKEMYNLRRKNVILLTGDVNGLFWNESASDFLFLSQTLYRELSDKFNIIRMDISTGLNYFDVKDGQEIMRVCDEPDGRYTRRSAGRSLSSLIESNRHSPLPNLVLLKEMTSSFIQLRRIEYGIKPLCIIIQYAGALLSPGDYDRLSDIDRQRLVFFLNWISDPIFRNSPELIIMINSVKSEINSKITKLPNVSHIEIPLPDEKSRTRFIDHFRKKRSGIKIKGGKQRFAEATAGLTLNNIKDMLEAAHRTGKPVTRQHVLDEVNTVLQAQLGNIISIKRPSHTPDQIIGYKRTAEIFFNLFDRCEEKDTAVSAVLVSGPNGSGKTFQLEAYAARSGRIVIELTGLRGSYFGQTDQFFELLRWHIATFGKILILVDEAHTAFGSVHSADTHKTEKRLAGNIIKMMGNPDFLGKVLWGLMTSRPDELDPDIKSRSPIQIPIFDLEGNERVDFVAEIFKRKKIDLSEQDIQEIVEKTDYYSARDYRNLVAEVLAARRKKPEIKVLEVLSGWQASRSIKTQREFQETIAALHCSYPKLLPERFRKMEDRQIIQKIEELKMILRH